MRRTFPIALGLLLAGCRDAHERGHGVALPDVPPAALRAARAKLPEVKFEAAWAEKEDGVQVYEIQGRTKTGRIRDVKVTEKGEVLETD